MKYRTTLITILTVAIATSVNCQDPAVPTSVVAAPSSSSGASGTPTTGLHGRNPRYQIRRGDTFDLDFALSPEFNQTVAVQPDGYGSFKGIGSLFIEGQTVPELTETVRAAYAATLHNPVITIAMKDFEKPYFIASGQVEKPGKYDLRSDLTITEAVAIAGGFNEKAKHSQVVLFRPTQTGGYETKLINIKKLLASRNLSEDLHLKPGDMLYVPQSAFSRIRPFIPTANMGAYLTPAMF